MKIFREFNVDLTCETVFELLCFCNEMNCQVIYC